jgi:hypothetical protein
VNRRESEIGRDKRASANRVCVSLSLSKILHLSIA